MTEHATPYRRQGQPSPETQADELLGRVLPTLRAELIRACREHPRRPYSRAEILGNAGLELAEYQDAVQRRLDGDGCCKELLHVAVTAIRGADSFCRLPGQVV
jgi:hypothetical protein